MSIIKNKELKNAILIGVASSIAYLICYFARNILSVMSPQIIETTTIDETYIGLLSTVNMWTYAGGQLINGIIGDKIKGKYLVSLGLILSGISNLCIGIFESRVVMLVAYGLVGFFLSMLYAPLTKLIVENTRPKHAENCCLGLALASLLGVPVAGVVALFFNWVGAFVFGGFVLIIVGCLFFLCVIWFEKQKIVQYQVIVKGEKQSGNFKILLQHQIIRFSLVSILTGVVRTSVAFWIPTYLSQYLGYSVTVSASIYAVMTCVWSTAPYIGNWILYERVLKRNMNGTLLVSFAVSSACFVFTFVLKIPFLNIVFLSIALLAESVAANMLWSVYCPSLRDTGMVSSATGYLDFLSYTAAGVANLLFANAISTIGWGNLILVWAALMGAGIIVSIPWKKFSNRQ